MKHNNPHPAISAVIVGMMFATLATCSGCTSMRGGSPGVTGGTAAERAMVNGAFNNMIPFLQARGFTNVKRPSKYKIKPVDASHVWILVDGGQQGTFIHNGQDTGAMTTANFMTFARPLHPWVANHEVTHALLYMSGYGAESNAHDRRAFDDGKHFPARRRLR